MAHKFVSTKDVMKNEGFLAKLGSTLAGRLNPDPLIETKAKSSITWRRTSDIKHRIKTATGTIAIYEDLTPEQLAEKQAEADRAAGGIAPDSAGPAPAATLEEEGAKEPALPTPTATPAAAADATAAGKEWWMEEMEEAGIGVGEAVRRAEKRTESVMQEQEGAEPGMTTTTTTTSTTTTTFTFLANEDYAPEDDDGLQVVSGQILTLIDKSSPHKRPRLEEGEGGATHLLDNSAAKHKMAIRPKRNHPDPRSRGHDTGEERWVMRDEDSGKEGLVPSRLLSPHAETTTTALRSSLKRTVQQIAKEEPLEVKQSLMKEIREYKSRKLSSRQLLGPSPEDEARAKRTATIRELVETEDEFVKDLQFVVENYYDLLDDPNTPRVIRDQKELIFNNFKRIAEFHQNVLIEGVKYHAEVPTMIGRTFLRLERDFDRHAEYCTNEPLAQEFMENNLTVKEFFEEQSQQLGDDKRLQEHLKLPIQRLNDYQLLLKELVKYSSRLGDDTNDLQKAHELMQTIPQRATDAKFINSIEGFKGNLYKLGRLVRHDWFTVKEEGQKARERYLFLFKARILVTKVKRISEDRSIFILRDIIRLPETSLGSLDNPKALEFLHIEPHAHPNYPIRIEARTAEIRESWLAGVEEYVVDTASVEDLLFDDELRVVSQEADEEDAKVSSSPIPEGQDYEELPEDEDQRAQSVKKAKREEEKPKEEEEGEQDFWAEWEETFEGKKSSKEQLEQVDKGSVKEQSQVTLTPPTTTTTTTTTTTPTTSQDPPLPTTTTTTQPPQLDQATGGKPQASGGKPKVTLPKPEEKAKKGAAMEEPSTPFTPGGTPKPVFTKTLKGDIVERLVTLPDSGKLVTLTLIEPGEDVAFVCEVTHPLPYFITWLKDNKPLDDKLADRVQQQDSGSKHTLRVLNCRIDDSGIYTAKATDEANSSSTCSAQLLVQEFTEEERARRYAEKSPFFLVRMKPTEVIENTNLSYTIHVKGDPMPEVQFLKDEQDIVEDERVTIHRDQQVGHYELLISHVQKEDEGVYKCVARNRFGKAECDAQMTVSDEKLVFQALSGKGSLLATGEKAEFKWFRDGQEFDPLERFNVMFKDDEDTLALVFQNVTPEDAGLYTCVASTSCGKISCSAELTVEGSINRLLRDPEPPSIKEEMTDTTVSIGGSAMLECKIGGYPKPELKWTKNGLDLEIGGRMRMLWEDEESVAFVIKNVEERDAGLYRVVVTNDLGEADCSAKLAIRAGPKIKKLLKEVACVVGQNLEYNIEVQGEPAPQVHIPLELFPQLPPPAARPPHRSPVPLTAPLFPVSMVDGRPVESTDRVSLKKVSDTLWTFTIKGMVAGDCGTYTVVAANEVGQVSDFFTVATDSAPQITRDLDPETEKKLNMDVTLEVRATGSPKPDARWYKNGKEIMADERFKMTRDDTFYILKIRHVERKDKGTYKCVLTNTSGEASTQGDLLVRAPPDFVTPLKDVCAKEGSKDVKLFVEWEANPPPTVKWFFKDRPVREDTEGYAIRGAQDTSQILCILQATPDFVGQYTVKAANEYGESTCKGRFRLHEPPSILQSLKDTEFLEFEASKFLFKAIGVPQPDVKWTKDGKKWTPDERRVRLKLEGEETYILIFEEALTVDSGHYVATVSNVEGTVTTEATLTVNKAEDSVDTPRTDPKAKENAEKQKPASDAMEEEKEKEKREKVESDDDDGRTKKKRKLTIAEAPDENEMQPTENGKQVTMENGDMSAAQGELMEIEEAEIGTETEPVKWRKTSTLHVSRDVETETAISDTEETSLTKAVNVMVQEDVLTREGPERGEEEVVDSASFYLEPDEVEGRPGMHVTASCSINRQQKGGKTIITAESDVGDEDDKATSRIVHVKQTMEVEQYLGLVTDNEDDTNLALPSSGTLVDPRVKALIQGTQEEGDQQEAPSHPIENGDLHRVKCGKLQPKKSVSFDEFPEVIEDIPLEDIELPKSKKALQEKDVSPKHSKASSGKTPKEPAPEEHEGPEGEEKGVKEAQRKLSRGRGSLSQDAEEAPPHIKGCNFNEGKTLIAHHKFLLEVEATSVPEAEATWYLDGKELPNGVDGVKLAFDGKKYTLERVGSDPEHSGEYKCVLKNKIAEGEEKGNITVKEKESRVRNKLEDVYVKEHTDAVIKCQIVGDPIPEVQWLRDGKPLPMSEKFEVSCERMAGWHTLVIKNVKEGDKCSFSVKGKNQHGECETTCRMGVLVKPAPGPLEDAVVDFGKDLYVSLTIHAFPAPTMVWTLNGQELKDGEHYEYTRNESREEYGIIFHGAALDDAGKLAFTASNDAGSETKSCLVRVHYETPTVVGGLEDTGFCLESDGTLTFRASGLPLPECHWTKNGIPLKNDNKHDITNPEPGVYCLTIKDVDQYDFGEVAVVAKSLVGECESKAKLSQKMLECSFVEALENLTNGPEGDDLTLSVTVRGSPRPKFVWTKNGDEVEASAKFKISSKKNSYCEATINLTIVEASAIDSGQYRLKCYNDVSEITTETALVVRPERRKPKVTKKPQELQVMEHQPGVFQAKIIGFPKPEVKWLKDGRQVYHSDVIDLGVTAEGIYYLEFRGVTQEDMGRYTVHASNDLGSCEADTQLTVVPPPSKPEFLSSLRSSKVILGYPVRLEVKLGGSPRPEVQWLKDGQPINLDGKHYKQVEGPDGTVCLQIDAATEGDAGEISCVAKNPEGDSTSKATLSVLGFTREDGQPDSPAKFTEGLKDISADEGDTLRLPVTMKGGPVPKMKWYKDGKEIKLGDRVFFTYDGDRAFLEVRPAQGEDSGMYKCVIENDHGKAETECEVSIRKCFEPPCFTSTFTNQYKLPGSDVRMTVKYDGLPLPEITWYHDNEKIGSDGDRVRVRKDGEGQTLLIRDATYSDAGVYRVVAKNREGTVEYKAELFVSDDIDPRRRMEAPVFLKVIGDQEVFEGSKALFKAIVMGKPEPEFRWYKDNSPIISTNRVAVEKDNDGLIRLSIRHVTAEDAGVYQLKAWNEYGEAACSGKLICETLTSKKKRPVGDEYQGFDRIRRSGVPMPLPDKPMISALSDRRATISWMPHLAAPPTQPVTYLLEMAEYPEGDWNTVRTGIRGCSVDVSNLLPKSDYRFRVRVANKHGVSEPSPYVLTYRHKLELPPITYEPWMDPNYEYKGEGPYVPEGFRINRDNRGNYYAAPRFLRLEHDTQYGMRGFNASLKWYAYGYPLPKVQFFRNDLPLDVGRKGSRYTYSHDATGAICLFVDRMTEGDIGLYDCLVTNEYGQSRQRLRLDLSEYPRVLQPLEELHLRANSSGKIMCRISGYPACDVKWFRDWEPLPSSYKFRPSFLEPDWYILTINGASVKDAGLYSVAAVNVAGSVHSSCMVHIEDDDIGFYWTGPGMGRKVGINSRRGTLEDHYDIGDELGRGTQGVSYHCVEHHTGRNFVAKSMWGKDNFKQWMRNEFDMMNHINTCKNIVRLYDAYESVNNMVLVTELCGGGDLLGTLTQRTYITEYEVCWYVRQLLLAADHMHDRCMAHLGINVGDILLVRPNGMEIKLGDLSLARNIRIQNVYPLDYGMPEFVAPEVANGEGVTYATDMWAIGVVTYILLSGISPFRGENDRETLTKVKKGEVNFDRDAFAHISGEAKDFILKLLDYKVDTRMEAKTALRHPWMSLASSMPRDPYRITTDRLRSYYSRFREWYANASCKRWFRRRTLSSCFSHPSKMVYPPGELYTPPESPEREIIPAKPAEDYHIPERDLSYTLDVFKNESNYQMGPDTYLLQLKDVEFPCRLRSYMKVAEDRSPSFAMSLRENDFDYSRIPMVHERRRFTDVMDEEIEEERRKRTMIDRQTAGFIRGRMESCALDLPRRGKYEYTTHLSLTERTRVVREGGTSNTAPFLREKPPTTAIAAGCKAEVTAVASGVPEPVIQWFKNEVPIGSDNPRITITTKGSRSTLTFTTCKDFDAGVYKVVARNEAGEASHKFRLVQGQFPGPCETPQVTQVGETEMFIRWKAPVDDGGARILCYKLEMKPCGATEWSSVADSIEYEFYHLTKLSQDSTYFFRVTAKNFLGWGDVSPSSVAVKTHATGVTGSRKVEVPPGLMHLQREREGGRTIPQWADKKDLDYSKELEPVKLKTGENAELQVRKYNPVAEISRGRFGTVAKCLRSDDTRVFVLKVMQTAGREAEVQHEFEAHNSLRHERIVQLFEAYSVGAFTVLVMEPLSGLDILSYLANQYQYSEQQVFTMTSQVLDALSYLHWRGYCHLDIQPDNIVVASTRRCDVKLIDFGSAQKVSKLGSDITATGNIEYTAPEVLLENKAHPSSDIWSLGVVIYALLAGRSAFGGVDEEDTKDNIRNVSFKCEYLNPGLSQELVRLIMLIFKRDPCKRPTVEECWDHKWLVESDYMAKKRERIIFYGARLREYDRTYHESRIKAAIKSPALINFNNAAFTPAISYDTENLCVV
ncbi:obscurin-like isoform X5 [Eriocheir sinensis]|uniref:obscurin-like isoform X5 n=1 Tax=Eriocheir sinensis TaxID=95602 RepID=UPI0021CAE2E1|nr:obscurin-like isoform X5 [Eriocheir sinensis]